MLLYSLLYLTGYSSISLDDMRHFRKLGSPCAGHPEYGHAAGIETTTGPLGQGIATAVGMALAERILNARFGDGLVDHKTYVIASDGDLMEGISHEAAGLAGNLKLSRLIVLYDNNHITIDGSTSLSDATDVRQRFEAYGWNMLACDGHDAAEVSHALDAAQHSDRAHADRLSYDYRLWRADARRNRESAQRCLRRGRNRRCAQGTQLAL